MTKFASYYNQNMELVREYRPEFELPIRNELPKVIVPLMSRSGDVTITYEGSLIHSKYDPVKEGRKFAAASEIEAGDDVICYGLGLGYHVEAVLDRIGENGRCYVIEVNRGLLTAAMILRDLSGLIKSDNLIIITGDDETSVAEKCSAVFSDLGGGSGERQAKIVVHSASFRFMPGGFSTIQNTFEVMLMERSVPQVFRKQSTENFLRNLDDILGWPGIDDVMPGLKGRPAFLVSAGPSLDEAIPHLQEYQERAWIFCVDTALSALIDASIKPDFVTIVDPQNASLEHFNGYLDCGVPLIFIPTASAEVIQGYPAPKVVAVQSDHSIVSKVERHLAHKGTISAGGSTACITLGILVKYGLNPIIMVGQDCGFPDMKVYSSNVLWTRKMLSSLSRFTTLEMKHRAVAMSRKLVMVKDKFGHDVPTHQNLYSYLKELERVIHSSSGTEFYNFFSKGAAISGTKELYFQEEVERILVQKLDKGLDPGISKRSFDEDEKRRIVEIISTMGDGN